MTLTDGRGSASLGTARVGTAGHGMGRRASRSPSTSLSEALRILTTAARVSGAPPPQTLYLGVRERKRRVGAVIVQPNGTCLAWDFRHGFLTGPWRGRYNELTRVEVGL